MNLSEILFICFFAVGFFSAVLGIISLVIFDSILKNIYRKNHQEWVNMGRPCGWFWVPKESKKSFTKSALCRNGYVKLFGDSDFIIKEKKVPDPENLIPLVSAYSQFRKLAFSGSLVAALFFVGSILAIFL